MAHALSDIRGREEGQAKMFNALKNIRMEKG